MNPVIAINICWKYWKTLSKEEKQTETATCLNSACTVAIQVIDDNDNLRKELRDLRVAAERVVR